MPLYEYECGSCAHRFERIQKFSDPLVDVCPKCGGVVRKLLSSPAIQFKGSGWYVTDYAKKSGNVEPSSSSSSKSDGSERGSEKSSERGSEKSSERSSETSGEKKSESSGKSSDTSSSSSDSKSAAGDKP
jgi:putative FmdB family regulatory protein